MFSNIPQKIVAILIALLLWQMVLIVETAGTTQTLEIPIEYVDEPEGLVRVFAPETITVHVQFLGQQFNFRTRDAVARVSLRDAQPGRRAYPVRVEVVQGLRSEVRATPETQTVMVEMDPRIEKRLRIDPKTSVRFTAVRSGMELAGASVDPDEVTIDGAQRYVAMAVRAQITVDLSKMENAGVYETEVEILDAEGNPIPKSRVSVVPAKVQFRPNLRAEFSRVLLIHPVVRGTPAPGYRVVSYELEPSEIKGRGDSTFLASLSTIETEPVDISGITEDRVFTLRYILPRGVTRDPSSPSTVQLRIRVARDQNQ